MASTKMFQRIITMDDRVWWCGYVGVSEGHPLYGKDWNVLPGLSFADFMPTQEGVTPGLWWFGFDFMEHPEWSEQMCVDRMFQLEKEIAAWPSST